MTAAVAAAGAAALIVAAVYLTRGDRYRLFASRHAAHCWNAVTALSPPAASLRPSRVVVEAARDEARTEVTIGYQMDRVLAGLELEARCSYAEGEVSASSIVLNGERIDQETLEAVNALR